MSRQEVLGLVLARAGSKSVPRKNIVPLLGKPLIAYTLASALTARSITRLVVTTDDLEGINQTKIDAVIDAIRERQLWTDTGNRFSLHHYELY